MENKETIIEEIKQEDIDQQVEKEVKNLEDVKLDKSSVLALEKAYKGGYLDGMIAGLHSAGICNESIATYLGADIPYVEQEVYYFKRTCESSGKMSEHIQMSDNLEDTANSDLKAALEDEVDEGDLIEGANLAATDQLYVLTDKPEDWPKN